MPQELNLAAKHDRFDVLENLGVFDCIECGCCDVVCPSDIRLTDSFRLGKRRLVQAMDPAARVRWLDAREQLRRQGVQDWERENGLSAEAKEQPQQRLEAVVDVIARVSRSS